MPFPSAAGVFISISIIISLLMSKFFSVNENNTQCNYLVNESNYIVCLKNIEEFRKDGLSILDNVISEEKLLIIEEMYDRYMREGSSEKQGRDFW